MKASKLFCLMIAVLVSTILSGCEETHLPFYFQGTWKVCHPHDDEEEHFPQSGTFRFEQKHVGSGVYKMIIGKGNWHHKDKKNLQRADFRVLPQGGKAEAAQISGAPPDCLLTEAEKKAKEGVPNKPGVEPNWKPTAQTIRLETEVCLKSEIENNECGPGTALHVVRVYVTPSKDSSGADRHLVTVDYCSREEGKNGYCKRPSHEKETAASDPPRNRTPHPGHIHGDD